MPQQDKFKREIDKIGLVLAKLLGLLIGKTNRHEEVIREVEQGMERELQMDVAELLNMDNSELILYLKEKKKFSVEHMKLLGDLLYELAIKTPDTARYDLLREKSRIIYTYVSGNSKIYYLDVAQRLK